MRRWSWLVGFGLLVVPGAACGCDSGAPQGMQNTKGAAPAPGQASPRKVQVSVSDKGYTPSTIQAKAGVPLALVFTRTTEAGCGGELVFPDRDIRRELPLNQPVTVEVTPKADQSIAFTCGMGMYRGAVVTTAE